MSTYVILRTIKNLETYDFWDLHCNNVLILDRECRKRRCKGQEMPKLALKLQREHRLAISIDVSELLIIYTETSSPVPTWPTGFKLEFI